jgi:NAD(P)-dependent dehydrogenase (short-subunit alcohol dehydrogenase family)
MFWFQGAKRSAGRRQLTRFGQRAARRTLFPQIFGTQPAPAKVAKKAIELGNGHVDILINNAGIYPFGPTHEMTEEEFDRVFSHRTFSWRNSPH